MSSIFVYWAPKLERTKMLGTSTAGAWVGNIIALPLSGYLCLNGFDSGWPSIFYIFGIASFVWSVVFILVITDSPKNHRFISKIEKDYLLEETKNEVSAKEKGPLITPWRQIFMSKVCWATFVAHFSNNWGNYLYLTQLPSFMKDVLKFDIKSV
jgi:MFS family permease